MISFDEDGIGKGSCRSIASFNIYEALEKCSAYLEKFGGHALAAGLTVRKENYEAFRNAILEIADSQLTQEDLSPKINIDCEIEAKDISMDTVMDIRYWSPTEWAIPRRCFCAGADDCRHLSSFGG